MDGLLTETPLVRWGHTPTVWITQAATFSPIKDEGEDDPCSPIQTHPGIPERCSPPQRSEARHISKHAVSQMRHIFSCGSEKRLLPTSDAFCLLHQQINRLPCRGGGRVFFIFLYIFFFKTLHITPHQKNFGVCFSCFCRPEKEKRKN